MGKCVHGVELAVTRVEDGNTILYEYPYCPKCCNLPDTLTFLGHHEINADGSFGPLIPVKTYD